MLVKEIYCKGDEYGEGECFTLMVDGEYIFSVGNGESEDNTLSCDLDFVWSIPGLLKKAYEDGVAGEPFEVIEELEDKLK